MLHWARRIVLFPRVHVREVDVCLRSFVRSLASRNHVKLPASEACRDRGKVSRNHANASASESKLCTQSAHNCFSASGDAKSSVRYLPRQDFGVNFCTDPASDLAHRRQEAKRHFVHGDATVFEFDTHMPYARVQFRHGDVSEAESVASPDDKIILASSSEFSTKFWSSDGSRGVPGTQSLHASLKTLLNQEKKSSTDWRQKIELLEAEQFSISDAQILAKKRAFKLCLVEQLATVLQMLKKSFPCAKGVHAILVRSSNVLLQPAELVQEKMNLLYDFEITEKVVSKLCIKGRVLSVRMEALQERLMFYKDIGMTVEARNTMFSRGPSILSFPLEKRVQPTLEFLDRKGIAKESILKLARSFPDVFYMSLDSNLIKKCEYFGQLGFSVDDFLRVFRYARRLSVKIIEEHMQFLETLGFTGDDVIFMLKRHPAIIAFTSETLKRKVDFLVSEQNRNMQEIVRCPSCLTYSLRDRMVPRFDVVNKLGKSTAFPLSCILGTTDSAFMKRFGKHATDSLFA